MAKTPKHPADDMPQGAAQGAAQGGAQGESAVPSNDDPGLINDEYSDDSLEVHELDALDVPGALRDASVLNEMADDSDGIEELDVLLAESAGSRITGDNGHNGGPDDAEMGLGAEPHTPEELADAAIGHELRGRRAVTRDGELHGEAMFDRPDEEARA